VAEEAIVVGAGSNGLAGAVTLAQRGYRVTVLEAAEHIGGCARSAELTVPGALHDVGASAHPTGVASPFFQSLGLHRYGLEWARPEVDLAHPLDGGTSSALAGSVADTAATLGQDGPAWQRLFQPLTDKADVLAAELLRPIAHVPSHPIALGRFGLRALPPASALARAWRGEPARALFGGLAAHSYGPLSYPLSSALGVLFGALGHRYGWPVARGGTHKVVDALTAVLTEFGGTIETGISVRSLDDLPPARIVLLDITPSAAITVLGDRLPSSVRRAYARFRHAPGAFKLDLAVEDGVPWRDAASRRAGTVHLAGSFAEIAAAEQQINRGRMPQRPFILASQQYLADPARSAGNVHPISAYAHVPHGYPGDATQAILDQFERFAPGTRERIVALTAASPSDLQRANPNRVGGDIITGANTPLQMMMRPRVSPHPYYTGVPGVYLCSAATPPGAGVHGMCGYHAATSALRDLRQRE
jgi:phytoene dehydrogenase-like protein